MVYISVLASVFFYATGHQTTISSIRWESAFVGLHGDFSSNILPAILIHLNTFASYVLAIIICPLIMLWPKAGGFLTKSVAGVNRKENTDWIGDFCFHDDKKTFRMLMFRMCLYSFAFQGIKVIFLKYMYVSYASQFQLFDLRFFRNQVLTCAGQICTS